MCTLNLHNILPTHTFSYPHDLIIYSIIGSEIHKGLMPSLVDYTHLYPFLKSQELEELSGAGSGFRPGVDGQSWFE